jgi:lactoylglutathione lyase
MDNWNDMKLVLAIAEDKVPSTHEPDPYMHIFLDAGGGNVLAFFEVPNSPPMGWDQNSPRWLQHIAFEVGSMEELEQTRAKLEANGVEVLGPTDHTIFQSIYFRDPDGHRLELAVNTGTPEMYKKLDEVKFEMIEEWARTKKAPKHAAWMHEKEFA